jgi:hypothetical protein
MKQFQVLAVIVRVEDEERGDSKNEEFQFHGQG